jgi:hypothetical protein
LEQQMTNHPNRNKNELAVLVTTAHRGVFFGYTQDGSGKTVVVRGMRNCLSWPSSVGGFVGLAVTGPNKDTRIGPALPGESTLQDVTGVFPCTEAAEKAWLAANWKF